MFRTKRFQAVVVLAAGALLGYVAATGGIRLDRSANASLANSQTLNPAPSESSVAVAASAPNGLECSNGNANALLFTHADAREQEPLLLAQASKAADQKSSGNGKKPNILFIMGDDIGWFNIGAYHRGIMSGKTPNLDKLASQGMLFTDYYAEASCTAGRANFITGEIPLRTGLTTVGQAGADVGIPAQACTLATALKAQGYSTGQFGKNHLGDLNKFLPTVHGFDEFFGYLYHLDAMSDPYWYSFPDDQAYRDKYGPRNLVHCYASDTDDAAVQPRWGKIGKQKVTDEGPLPPFPNMTNVPEHAQHFREGQVRHDHLRRSVGQKLV